MPPKSLAEWLADSSDDDEKDTEVLTTHQQQQQAKTPTSSTVKTPTTNFTTATAIKSPVVSAAAIASAGAHQHQNNKANSLSTTPRNTSLSTTPTNPALLAIRERMQNLLGSETVSKIVEENRQVKPAVISSSSSSDSSDSDDDDDQQKVVAPVAVNKTGKKKNGAESDKNLEGTLVTPNAGENLMVTAVAVEPSYEEYDVEVVDRGCQTINEIETQTDPEPDVFSCPCCYQEYFGHQAGNSNIPLACHPHPQQHHQQLYYPPPPHHPYYYSYPPQQQTSSSSSFPQSLSSMNPNTLGTSNNQNQQNEGLTKSSSRIPASVINAQVDSIQRQIDSIMKRLGGGGI